MGQNTNTHKVKRAGYLGTLLQCQGALPWHGAGAWPRRAAHPGRQEAERGGGVRDWTPPGPAVDPVPLLRAHPSRNWSVGEPPDEHSAPDLATLQKPTCCLFGNTPDLSHSLLLEIHLPLTVPHTPHVHGFLPSTSRWAMGADGKWPWGVRPLDVPRRALWDSVLLPLFCFLALR